MMKGAAAGQGQGGCFQRGVSFDQTRGRFLDADGRVLCSVSLGSGSTKEVFTFCDELNAYVGSKTSTAIDPRTGHATHQLESKYGPLALTDKKWQTADGLWSFRVGKWWKYARKEGGNPATPSTQDVSEAAGGPGSGWSILKALGLTAEVKQPQASVLDLCQWIEAACAPDAALKISGPGISQRCKWALDACNQNPSSEETASSALALGEILTDITQRPSTSQNLLLHISIMPAVLAAVQMSDLARQHGPKLRGAAVAGATAHTLWLQNMETLVLGPDGSACEAALRLVAEAVSGELDTLKVLDASLYKLLFPQQTTKAGICAVSRTPRQLLAVTLVFSCVHASMEKSGLLEDQITSQDLVTAMVLEPEVDFLSLQGGVDPAQFLGCLFALVRVQSFELPEGELLRPMFSAILRRFQAACGAGHSLRAQRAELPALFAEPAFVGILQRSGTKSRVKYMRRFVASLYCLDFLTRDNVVCLVKALQGLGQSLARSRGGGHAAAEGAAVDVGPGSAAPQVEAYDGVFRDMLQGAHLGFPEDHVANFVREMETWLGAGGSAEAWQQEAWYDRLATAAGESAAQPSSMVGMTPASAIQMASRCPTLEESCAFVGQWMWHFYSYCCVYEARSVAGGDLVAFAAGAGLVVAATCSRGQDPSSKQQCLLLCLETWLASAEANLPPDTRRAPARSRFSNRILTATHLLLLSERVVELSREVFTPSTSAAQSGTFEAELARVLDTSCQTICKCAGSHEHAGVDGEAMRALHAAEKVQVQSEAGCLPWAYIIFAAAVAGRLSRHWWAAQEGKSQGRAIMNLLTHDGCGRRVRRTACLPRLMLGVAALLELPRSNPWVLLRVAGFEDLCTLLNVSASEGVYASITDEFGQEPILALTIQKAASEAAEHGVTSTCSLAEVLSEVWSTVLMPVSKMYEHLCQGSMTMHDRQTLEEDSELQRIMCVALMKSEETLKTAMDGTFMVEQVKANVQALRSWVVWCSNRHPFSSSEGQVGIRAPLPDDSASLEEWFEAAEAQVAALARSHVSPLDLKHLVDHKNSLFRDWLVRSEAPLPAMLFSGTATSCSGSAAEQTLESPCTSPKPLDGSPSPPEDRSTTAVSGTGSGCGMLPSLPSCLKSLNLSPRQVEVLTFALQKFAHIEHHWDVHTEKLEPVKTARDLQRLLHAAGMALGVHAQALRSQPGRKEARSALEFLASRCFSSIEVVRQAGHSEGAVGMPPVRLSLGPVVDAWCSVRPGRKSFEGTLADLTLWWLDRQDFQQMAKPTQSDASTHAQESQDVDGALRSLKQQALWLCASSPEELGNKEAAEQLEVVADTVENLRTMLCLAPATRSSRLRPLSGLDESGEVSVFESPDMHVLQVKDFLEPDSMTTSEEVCAWTSSLLAGAKRVQECVGASDTFNRVRESLGLPRMSQRPSSFSCVHTCGDTGQEDPLGPMSGLTLQVFCERAVPLSVLVGDPHWTDLHKELKQQLCVKILGVCATAEECGMSLNNIGLGSFVLSGLVQCGVSELEAALREGTCTVLLGAGSHVWINADAVPPAEGLSTLLQRVCDAPPDTSGAAASPADPESKSWQEAFGNVLSLLEERGDHCCRAAFLEACCATELM